MKWIDTHAHVYLDQFESDLSDIIERSKTLNVKEVYLPNIDLESLAKAEALETIDPDFFKPMIGLHPCDVKENFEEVLDKMESHLEDRLWAGIGETGIDLYWDKTFLEEQKESFARQIKWADHLNRPVIIHCRDSFDEIFEVCDAHFSSKSFGILHCFTGTQHQAERAIELGLKLGIGGVLTFKNSGLKDSIKDIDLDHLVLETDSPFLAPTPYRGKRNEPSYIPIIGEHLSTLKGVSIEEVAEITTRNAHQIFTRNESI